jgi:hypothetical protein
MAFVAPWRFRPGKRDAIVSVSDHENGKVEQMRGVRVSIEVRNRAAHFCVAIQAESIRRAVSIVARRYPDYDVGVKFSIHPEGFFVEDTATRAGMVAFEQPKKMVA